MADVNNMDDNKKSGHLIIDVDEGAPRVESDDDEKVHHFGAWAGKTADGQMAVATTGAGAITTAGKMNVNTAGAGSVTVSGSTGVGDVNTSGAGSVHTYSGVSTPKDNNVVEENEEDCTRKLSWVVGVLGGLADCTAAAAAMYKSPRGVAALGGHAPYHVGIASVFAAGVAEMVAAFWVCSDTKTRGATGKKILYVAVFTLLLGLALDGVAIGHKN